MRLLPTDLQEIVVNSLPHTYFVCYFCVIRVLVYLRPQEEEVAAVPEMRAFYLCCSGGRSCEGQDLGQQEGFGWLDRGSTGSGVQEAGIRNKSYH